MYSLLLTSAVLAPMQNSDNTATIVFGIIFGVLWGFVCKGMYEKKGRSPGWGFAIGFFLGLIGVIICAIVPATAEKQAQLTAPKADEMKCPHCLEIIKKGAVVCKHCGKNPKEVPQ